MPRRTYKEFTFSRGHWLKGIKKQLFPKTIDVNGKSRKWIPGDTTNTGPDKKFYAANPIIYSFNSHGWRMDDEIDFKAPSNLYLGCSHTFGSGLHLQDTWSYKVQKEINNYQYVNLSWPGNGPQACFNTLELALLNNLNIKNLFLYAPHYTRMVYYDPYKDYDGTFETYNPAWKTELSELDLLMAEPDNFNTWAEACILNIKKLCRENKIKFYSMTDTVYSYMLAHKSFRHGNCPCGKFTTENWEDYKWDGSSRPHWPRDNHYTTCAHDYIASDFIKCYKKGTEGRFTKSFSKYVD
tara:strand:+ start:414 stop:1301 length:888 start_codon:yes stop_codon:yes gene_type:complete